MTLSRVNAEVLPPNARLAVLRAMAEQVENAWGDRRPDRILARYPWASGSNVLTAASSEAALADVLAIPTSQVSGHLAGAVEDGLVVELDVASERMYVLSPVGYYLAKQDKGSDSVSDVRDHVLEVVIQTLSSRWRDATRSERIENVAMPPLYASFLLFMLLGGAVGKAQPLRWDKADTERAEAARAILRSLALQVGWNSGDKMWAQNEELANLTRRPELKRYFGKQFHKEDNRKTSESLLYFEVEPTVQGLRPLFIAIERSLGAQGVVNTVTHLERLPWAKGPFAAHARQIRRLFGQHLCPEPYRHTLTEAAIEAQESIIEEPERNK